MNKAVVLSHDLEAFDISHKIAQEAGLELLRLDYNNSLMKEVLEWIQRNPGAHPSNVQSVVKFALDKVKV